MFQRVAQRAPLEFLTELRLELAANTGVNFTARGPPSHQLPPEQRLEGDTCVDAS